MLSDRIGPDVKTQWILTLSQCTFWCSVLSDTSGPVANNTQTKWSQCTFWCSVLSDKKTKAFSRHIGRVSMHLLVLSAFRHDVDDVDGVARRVSMHLLVLSAFRPERELEGSALHVSMHLLVFSAFRHNKLQPDVVLWIESQCTFWCSVLSDQVQTAASNASALGLNAPSGAQCFPTATADWSLLIDYKSQCTFWCSVLSDTSRGLRKPSTPRVSMHLLVLSAFRLLNDWEEDYDPVCLNAPSGAQCFPTRKSQGRRGREEKVSMHLLVLSAFRPKNAWLTSSSLMCGLNAPSGAQCFPTCNRA